MRMRAIGYGLLVLLSCAAVSPAQPTDTGDTGGITERENLELKFFNGGSAVLFLSGAPDSPQTGLSEPARAALAHADALHARTPSVMGPGGGSVWSSVKLYGPSAKP